MTTSKLNSALLQPAMRCLRVVGLLTFAWISLLSGSLGAAQTNDDVSLRSVLVSEGTPDTDAVSHLIAALQQRDPVLREAAIARLIAHPDIAARPVTEAFLKGNLAMQLSALELLREWGAPVQGLDPWRPETLRPDRRDSLKAWSTSPDKLATSQKAELTDEQLLNVRQQIDRMIATDDESEMVAIRERLGRLGQLLSPELSRQLAVAATDRQRERLTALQYRLAVPITFVLDWPRGLMRLASADPQTRQAASEELDRHANADAVPLLRQLLDHPDALVRENSLRTFSRLKGRGATDTLIELLDDPQPNVRAAVLRELAQYPSQPTVQAIAGYVKNEQDQNLLAQAARTLGAIGGDTAVITLVPFSQHATWQVRAEAAEAIGVFLANPDGLSDEPRALAALTVADLLDDHDPFVAARAATALVNADANAAFPLLISAASAHPEAVSRAIAFLKLEQKQAASPLRDLCRHEHPSIRASAIGALCKVAPRSASPELLAALSDRSDAVRLAAARAVLTVLDACRPGPEPIATRPETQTSDSPDWLERFLAGAGRPAWCDDLIEPLQHMLASPLPEQRLSAALALLPLGQKETALPIVHDLAASEPAFRDAAAEALPWLPVENRIQLFNRLLALDPSLARQSRLIEAMVRYPDPRAAGAIWDLSARQGNDMRTTDMLLAALRQLYFGPARDVHSDVCASRRNLAVADAAPRAHTGPEPQRIVALTLLLNAARDRATPAAAAVLQDTQVSDNFRRNALQIMLLSQGPDRGIQTAVTTLTNDQPHFHDLAVTFLLDGPAALRYLDNHTFALYLDGDEISREARFVGGKPAAPPSPVDVQPDALMPLLESTDPQRPALAGYLLALLDDDSAFDVLTRYWQTHARNDPAWTRLVYRAVVALDDEKRLPLLEEIYQDMDPDEDEIREFYWTVRAMQGDRAAAFHGRIRREVGMDRLK